MRIVTFRGLLGLHSRYGPPDRSAARGDLCHEASALAVARTSRSSATGSIDNSPGWSIPPLMIRAFGAHCQHQTSLNNNSRTCGGSVI
jgi:hypothetical protein